VYDDQTFAHVDLRVDVHPEPIGELRRMFDEYRPAIPYYNLRQVDARVPPLDDWMKERGGTIGHGQGEDMTAPSADILVGREADERPQD
jgi:uncharacterized Ntn-hydrolase superfamily protein